MHSLRSPSIQARPVPVMRPADPPPADGPRSPAPRAHDGRSDDRHSHDPPTGDSQRPGPRPGADVDADELRDLVETHGDAVFRLALSIVRDVALAEDIAQDALVKAWLALPTLQDRSALKSWLLRITHNTAISTIRVRRAVVVDPAELPERPSGSHSPVETRVQSDAVVDDFVAALDHLDELSRSIVVLRELEGLSYGEIVEVLQIPLPTVKTRLLRARRQLGAALRGWA